MKIGTGTDSNTKPEEVYNVMVLLNSKMTQAFVIFREGTSRVFGCEITFSCRTSTFNTTPAMLK
mgnify:CR=1 FL=1